MQSFTVSVFPTKDWVGDPSTLPTFDNTKLVAINTCPTWGLVRYEHHKIMGKAGRQMALEAGSASHDVFAAHRLYALLESGAEFYDCPQDIIAKICHNKGVSMFGEERLETMLANTNDDEEYDIRVKQFALNSLYSGDFYDSMDDKRRTISTIEEMCIVYMDKYDWRKSLPVVKDEFVGIEIEVDVVIIFAMNDGSVIRIRFIGKADGLHYTDKTKKLIRVHENKTASRLGDAWEMSWETNHQPTGYLYALSHMMNEPINQSIMIGTCLPMPKAAYLTGLSRVVVQRKPYQFDEWLQWLLYTYHVWAEFKDNAPEAPKFTHSCNRYFRPCSFIPLCASDPEERKIIFDDMDVDKWSPLEEDAAGD